MPDTIAPFALLNGYDIPTVYSPDISMDTSFVQASLRRTQTSSSTDCREPENPPGYFVTILVCPEL
jgi:hypothetical protein